MTSKWSEVKPEGFYVYIHRRFTDSTVFYVGKGKGDRAWNKCGRSDYWKSIAAKNGVEVEILQDGLAEADAFDMEVDVISSLSSEGVALVNMTNGGDGTSGLVSRTRKRVYCSNGMVFDGCCEAQDWLIASGISVAYPSSISSACTRDGASAYGYTWSYECTPKALPDYRERIASTLGVAVYCSNGMVFDSTTAAVHWLKSVGHARAVSANIISCCKGRCRSAYGYAWSRDGIPQYAGSKSDFLSKEVACSNGMTFKSLGEAVEWLQKNGHTRARRIGISNCARGKAKTAYGYSWEYA
jgi:hypothetical protein